MRVSRLIEACLSIALPLWVAGCGPSAFDLALLREQTEASETTLREAGLEYADPELQAYLESLAALLAAQAPAGLPAYRVAVLRDPVLNAFTLPDGTLYLSAGALAAIDDEAQLAFLVAHELNHVALGHNVSALAGRRLNQTLAARVNPMFFGPFPLSSNPSFVGPAAGYVPKLEEQADLGAMRWLAGAGFATGAALGVFEALDRIEDPLVSGGLWNDHARSRERKALLAKATAPASAAGRNDADRFRRAVRPVAPESARLRFASGEFKLAIQAAARASERYGESAELHYVQGQSQLLLVESLSEAEAHMRRALELDPSHRPAQRGLAEVLLARGDFAGAQAAFDGYLERYPDAPDADEVRALAQRKGL